MNTIRDNVLPYPFRTLDLTSGEISVILTQRVWSTVRIPSCYDAANVQTGAINTDDNLRAPLVAYSKQRVAVQRGWSRNKNVLMKGRYYRASDR